MYFRGSRGWSGLTNGSLLKVAEDEFDVLITGDQNLTSQHESAALISQSSW
jgi:hypothetical protein